MGRTKCAENHARERLFDVQRTRGGRPCHDQSQIRPGPAAALDRILRAARPGARPGTRRGRRVAGRLRRGDRPRLAPDPLEHGQPGAGHGPRRRHTIPVAPLEEIGLLKGGASAIYGSEAVAGMINFVTRKDYGGLRRRERLPGHTRARRNGLRALVAALPGLKNPRRSPAAGSSTNRYAVIRRLGATRPAPYPAATRRVWPCRAGPVSARRRTPEPPAAAVVVAVASRNRRPPWSRRRR